jgi:hypothetical protein
VNLEAIQLRRAEEQMRDERCYRIVRWRHERDSWNVRTDRPVQHHAPRERCLGCGKDRRGSHFASYCNSCGLRVHTAGTVEGPQDYLIWKIGRTVRVSDTVNRKET